MHTKYFLILQYFLVDKKYFFGEVFFLLLKMNIYMIICRSVEKSVQIVILFFFS